MKIEDETLDRLFAVVRTQLQVLSAIQVHGAVHAHLDKRDVDAAIEALNEIGRRSLLPYPMYDVREPHTPEANLHARLKRVEADQEKLHKAHATHVHMAPHAWGGDPVLSSTPRTTTRIENDATTDYYASRLAEKPEMQAVDPEQAYRKVLYAWMSSGYGHYVRESGTADKYRVSCWRGTAGHAEEKCFDSENVVPPGTDGRALVRVLERAALWAQRYMHNAL